MTQTLCRIDEIPDGDAIGLTLDAAAGGADIILLRQGRRVFAYYNECPHAGRNLDYAPGRFMVRDGRIMCAVHGATFAVEGGECCGGPARSGLVAVPIEVVDGDVRLVGAGIGDSGLGIR
ncbi:MAG: Rieske (2Fe-2S) protein [Xanthomonadales bacterium]|nr:Rieske (2Fe-2S) protein [Xanthomonadales bacterium]